jgi:hypothetical protein
MNIFELNVLAVPFSGLVGGLTAVKGLSGAMMAAAGGLGLGIGIGVYFGAIGIMGLTMKASLKNPDSKAGKLAGLVFVLLMIPLFFYSFWIANRFVGLIWG